MSWAPPPPTEAAWAAGFIDGEGCFTGTESQQLTVVQADREPLERLQRICGGAGWISERRANIGKKRLWAYNLAKFEDFQQVVALLWPHMCGAKREQVYATTMRVRACRLARLVNGQIDKSRKLTLGDAREIKVRVAAGEDHGSIAADYGCCRQNVNAIARGRSWKAA